MSVRTRLAALAFMGCATGVVLVAAPGEAVVTRTFSLDTATELSAGVLDRVSVTADGTVVLGADVQRIAPPDTVGSVWSLLDMGDGSVLAGTGVDGRVYRIQRNTATLYAETGAVVVTSLTRADDGTVYAGTLPDGKLFRLNPPAGVTRAQVLRSGVSSRVPPLAARWKDGAAFVDFLGDTFRQYYEWDSRAPSKSLPS